MMHERFDDHRVAVEPAPVRSGGKVSIHYHGLLSNSGADAIYLHYGYDGWRDPRTVPMQRTADGGFSAEISTTADRELNFCFKDSANNWDNNSGWNWRCEIV